MLEWKLPGIFFWYVQLTLSLTVQVSPCVNFSYSYTQGNKNMHTATHSSLQKKNTVLYFCELQVGKSVIQRIHLAK